MSHKHTAVMRTARAFSHQHCACYYQLRSAVRVVFWTAIIIGIVYGLHKFCQTQAAIQICSVIGDCQTTR